MQSLGRRLRANTYYLKRPFLDFLPLLLMMIGLILLGGICFHNLYEQKQLTFAESFYTTYCLIFMEHLYDFPHHWVLQAFYFVLPPLGLAVVLDGIVRFSYHVLRRDLTGKEWVQAMAKTLDDHVILCGLGKLGLRATWS